MNKSNLGVLSSCLAGSLAAIVFLVACSQENITTSIPDSKKESIINSINNVESKTTIRGIAQFPTQNKNFKIKSHIPDVASKSTVSLIYTSDHPTNPNVTIATGLTDDMGSFTVNPNVGFVPKRNEVYVLEASKRVGGTGQQLLSLRTYIKWNGTSWQGMTTPSIFINSYTTALSIISGFNPSMVSSLSTIGTISVNNNVSTPSTIGSVTSETIMKVANLANQALINYQDPLTIDYKDGNYYINIINNAPMKGKQVDRLGLPSLNIVFNGYNGFTKAVYDGFSITKEQRDMAKDSYNMASPSKDVEDYRDFWATAINAIFARGTDTSNALATALTPDVYTIDINSETSFGSLNGRLLSDDVIDTELKLLSGNNAATDGISNNDKEFSNTFPYLAQPF